MVRNAGNKYQQFGVGSSEGVIGLSSESSKLGLSVPNGFVVEFDSDEIRYAFVAVDEVQMPID